MPAPTTFTNDVVFQGAVVVGGTLTSGSGGITNSSIAAGANVAYSKLEHLHHFIYQQSRKAAIQRVRSDTFDLDNGAGTTVDDVVMKPTAAVTITAARIIYTDATTGTVAAGSAKVGVTLAGAEVVAATNYANTTAVGTATTMTIVSGAVAAGTGVFVRHTGVASTQAGKAVVELEFTEDADTNGEIYDTTVPLNIAAISVGTLVSVQVEVDTIPTSTRAHTVDLQKGNAGSGYATVLSAPATIDSSSVIRTVQSAAISSAAAAAGDSYQLVVASSGSGNNGRRLKVTVRYAEETV